MYGDGVFVCNHASLWNIFGERGGQRYDGGEPQECMEYLEKLLDHLMEKEMNRRCWKH